MASVSGRLFAGYERSIHVVGISAIALLLQASAFIMLGTSTFHYPLLLRLIVGLCHS
jgi:hypothetical protein